MKKDELANFYNHGFGWVCRSCEEKRSAVIPRSGEIGARILNEGESEEKNPIMATSSMAKWNDSEKSELICPICKSVETIG